MKSKCFTLTISAETKENANEILRTLIDKKLVPGGPVINSPAKFFWKGEVIDMDYFTIMTFTLAKHKDAIIKATEKVSIEEVPMITFAPLDGNDKLLNWIEKTVG